MITQKAYRELRKEVKECIHGDILFKKVLDGMPLIQGFKADVSFSPLNVKITSVSLAKLDSNTMSPRDMENLTEHLAHSPLASISMICIDFNYDFKVFKSQFQTFGDDILYNIVLPSDEVGGFVAVKCIDVTGNELLQVYNARNT